MLNVIVRYETTFMASVLLVIAYSMIIRTIYQVIFDHYDTINILYDDAN